MGKSSNLFKFDDFTWSQTKKEDYKPSNEGVIDFSETTVQHIVENGLETCFHLDYYECSNNGFTSLEKIEETHAVIILRGEGKVIINEDEHLVKPLDIIIIPKNATHQFISTDDEPFGFLCIVNA